MTVSSLRRNFAWAFTGSVVLSGSQLLVLVALAKWSGDAETGATRSGDWGVALSVTGPVFVFCLLKLRALQSTDTRDETRWATYVAVRLVAMLVALTVSVAIGAIGYRDHTTWIIAGVAMSKVFEGGSDLIYGHLQRIERQDRIAISQLGRGLTTMVVTVVVLLATRSVVLLGFAVALVYAGWMLWDLAYARRAFAATGPGWDRGAIERLLRLAAPLGLVTAIGSLQANVPRYFLDGYASRADVGAFSSLTTLLMLGGLVITTIANAAVARLARYAAAEDWRAFTSTLRRLIAIGALLGVVAVVLSATIGGMVLRLVYSDAFVRHQDVLVWLAASSGLLWTYMFFGTALDALRQFRIQPWIHGASTVVIAVASWRLIPHYELRGAAWAIFIGFGVESILYFVAVALPLRAAMRGGAT